MVVLFQAGSGGQNKNLQTFHSLQPAIDPTLAWHSLNLHGIFNTFPPRHHCYNINKGALFNKNSSAYHLIFEAAFSSKGRGARRSLYSQEFPPSEGPRQSTASLSAIFHRNTSISAPRNYWHIGIPRPQWDTRSLDLPTIVGFDNCHVSLLFLFVYPPNSSFLLLAHCIFRKERVNIE